MNNPTLLDLAFADKEIKRVTSGSEEMAVRDWEEFKSLGGVSYRPTDDELIPGSLIRVISTLWTFGEKFMKIENYLEERNEMHYLDAKLKIIDTGSYRNKLEELYKKGKDDLEYMGINIE